MPFLMVRHKVNDYDTWKPVYDDDAQNRKDHGCIGARVLRNANNPNEVIVITEFSDHDAAKSFAESPNLRGRMQSGGVADHPDVFFLDEVERSDH